ncbi:MAB_1171c family putative transporter [Rhodococcus tibetensis]|uniref:DUF6545 domain-containing protein n=1 Tax=Rhodococcus tibetensis TaxID=2965064 RepID=A0ABT1QFJ1_9NOCA|nr:MAB_1171c family putative transporter [Rhodococcus sp. FXJ9.536]MCQ4120982.1 hypothetical protein [Rhodococcus sp. FXJ9.536]
MYTPPAYMTLPLLLIVWATTILRLTLVRSTVAERRLNAALVFASLSLVLGRPAVRDLIDGGFGYGLTRILGNVCIMLTAASLISLFCVWALGPERLPRIHLFALSAALVAGAIMIALSAPARSRGVSLADEGGWRFAAYCLTYASPIFGAACLNLSISLKAVRSAVAGRERRIFLAVIGLSVFEMADMAIVMLTGVSKAVGDGSTFTESHYDSGAFIRLFAVSAGALIALGPALRAADRRYRSWRVARRLLPMWQTLTEAVPEVVLELRPDDRRTLSSDDRLDRMGVEIRDAILVLDRYMVFELGNQAGSAAPVVAATRLHLACKARIAGHPAHGTGVLTHSWSSDIGGEPWELARLADHWHDAEQVAATLWARRLPQFGGLEAPIVQDDRVTTVVPR